MIEPSCPLPARDAGFVQIAHGGGGRAMNALIRDMFAVAFRNPFLDAAHDGAVFSSPPGRLAFSTDSCVVRPLFFPGGDIGSLAVNGTVNDLAMCGARPLHLSAGFILEEGLPLETLRRVVASMAASAKRAGVSIVTGDTKVVERGKGDGLYVNTSGIGAIEHALAIAPASVRPGDAILLSGDLGRHGIAILAARAELSLECPVESDCAPLISPVLALLAAGIEIHCLRDLTRGGLASAVVEVAETSLLDVELDERAIPISAPVRSACELLGFDPLHVANEGRFAAWIAPADADRALAILRGLPDTRDAVRVGRVTGAGRGSVAAIGPLGVPRAVDMFTGEQLPRIC